MTKIKVFITPKIYTVRRIDVERLIIQAFVMIGGSVTIYPSKFTSYSSNKNSYLKAMSGLAKLFPSEKIEIKSKHETLVLFREIVVSAPRLLGELAKELMIVMDDHWGVSTQEHLQWLSNNSLYFDRLTYLICHESFFQSELRKQIQKSWPHVKFVKAFLPIDVSKINTAVSNFDENVTWDICLGGAPAEIYPDRHRMRRIIADRPKKWLVVDTIATHNSYIKLVKSRKSSRYYYEIQKSKFTFCDVGLHDVSVRKFWEAGALGRPAIGVSLATDEHKLVNKNFASLNFDLSDSEIVRQIDEHLHNWKSFHVNAKRLRSEFLNKYSPQALARKLSEHFN